MHNSPKEKYHKKKQHHFIQEVLMVLPNYMVFGLQKIIVKHIIYLHQMEFYSTMNLQEGEKHL